MLRVINYKQSSQPEAQMPKEVLSKPHCALFISPLHFYPCKSFRSVIILLNDRFVMMKPLLFDTVVLRSDPETAFESNLSPPTLPQAKDQIKRALACMNIYARTSARSD